MAKTLINIDQLCIGLYIELPLKWSQHPFLLNHFKITSAHQLAAIQRLGLKQIWFDPDKSDEQPRPPAPANAPDPDPDARLAEAAQAAQQLWQQKTERFQRLKKHRQGINQCEKHYNKSVQGLRGLMNKLMSRPQEAVEEAHFLIEDIVTTLLNDTNLVVHLMNDSNQDDNLYYHALNVSVLSLMLGKKAGLNPKELHDLGLGALFHDLGKNKIPTQVQRKQDPLTKAEQSLLELHPRYGLELTEKIPGLPAEAVKVIGQHHEKMNGSGYPHGLKGEQISRLSRIVAITNQYDNLCNQNNLKVSLSPYEALSTMFSQQKAEFDPQFLSLFVHCMGVYPPGTLVQLNNGMLGLVISIDQANLLLPQILIYDPNIPKEEAIILDLREDRSLSISKSVRPSRLPKEVYDYLSPRTQINYFIASPQGSKP